MSLAYRRPLKAVLITGASSGIGEACALEFAQRGWRVFAGVRSEADAQKLKHQGAGEVIPVILDVTQPATLAQALLTITRLLEGQGLEALINNAGIATAGPLEFVPLEVMRQQLEVNVTGQLAVIQACLPLLRQSSGRILNMSSISGIVAKPFVGVYSASKFALEGLSDALRLELEPWQIKVILIEPGAIATPIWEKSAAEAKRQMAPVWPQVQEFYGAATQKVEEAFVHLGQTGVPIEEVVQTVWEALTSELPRTRYLVGRSAQGQACLKRLLPAGVMDRLIARKLGLFEKKYQTFEEFYPFYLAEHSHPTCRRLHVIGSSLILLMLVYLFFSGSWGLIWTLPVLGYGLAWVGHYFFQKNHPATFTYPLWSLMGDWKMYKDHLTGKIKW